ncbi:MAG: type I-D CRISPR-associated helicase Cas3' [Anaerolineae bacterium]|nr:type I-D CRISPR-associated helicase Cas3' [Anaerolineae bacterium]
MDPLTVDIAPLAFEQVEQSWLPNYKPYRYQAEVYRRVQEALTANQTLCLFLVTPTGSGKTLASYAYAITHQLSAVGVYPTNELLRDQESTLKPHLDPHNEHALLRIDGRALDDWQAALDLGRHATTLETLMNWQPTILTNPDILFYVFFGLYKGPASLNQRLFTLLGQYRQFVFDEFHLYNVKQMADVAFFVATLHTIKPQRGRVFLFASATPESPALPWLRDQLKLPVEVVECVATDSPDARTIAHPLQLTVLPADLRHWQGVECLLAYLPQVRRFVQDHPQARLVTILDSVAGAIKLAQTLREEFPGVGEVHGFSSDQERAGALRQPFTVGTSTIEVGIDFKDETGKDVLIYEARTASQFVQRFGRLARHIKTLPIPNWAIAMVPEYVYHFLEGQISSDQTFSRQALYRLIEEAYQRPEDFKRYLGTHASVEFQEARLNIQPLFQPDVDAPILAGLENAIQSLTGQPPAQVWARYKQYKEEKILAPLLTFRGSGFEAAILDERGSDPGFLARRYSLAFLLRRGVFTEIDEEEYQERLNTLAERWPEGAAREKRCGERIRLGPEELLGVYGHFVLMALQDQARKIWFEISEDEVHGRKGQVTVVSGLEIVTDPELRLPRLQRHIRRKKIVAWFIDRHPASLKLGRALPPLFEVYELRVRRIGGKLSETPWSIAFNQNAFFLDSLRIGFGRTRDWRRSAEEEMIL